MDHDLLTLRLFHGRRHPDETLDDWGFDGPCLGPFTGVQLTYGHVAVFGRDQERLEIAHVDDLLFYDGSYFGDASIDSVAVQPPNADFDERLTSVPPTFHRRVRRPIAVPRRLLPEYRRRIEVFADSIRELLGDAAAEAARAALSTVLKDG